MVYLRRPGNDRWMEYFLQRMNFLLPSEVVFNEAPVLWVVEVVAGYQEPPRFVGTPSNPNCGCIDPNASLVLNPAAWSDAPAEQWGTCATYYNDYRWQHQATENMSIGRTFPIRERMSFQSSPRSKASCSLSKNLPRNTGLEYLVADGEWLTRM